MHYEFSANVCERGIVLPPLRQYVIDLNHNQFFRQTQNSRHLTWFGLFLVNIYNVDPAHNSYRLIDIPLIDKIDFFIISISIVFRSPKKRSTYVINVSHILIL